MRARAAPARDLCAGSVRGLGAHGAAAGYRAAPDLAGPVMEAAYGAGASGGESKITTTVRNFQPVAVFS